MGRRRPSRKPRVDLETFDMSQSKIYNYYKNVLSEPDLALWAGTMKKPLPITFRLHGIHGDRESALLYKELFIERFSKRLESLEVEGEGIEMPHPISWYPDNLAWEMDIPRKVIRKIPALGDLHSFLIQQHDEGYITRQEAVSMIPPFFLDIHEGDCVLDMCAAPGSKTTQLVDKLHEANMTAKYGKSKPGEIARDLKWLERDASEYPKTLESQHGLVVANDADLERCFMLVSNVCRLTSPALVVTNNDASKYPEAVGIDGKPLRYDRILADVPCSGDGTLRKSPDIWVSWEPSGPAMLHQIQLRIAKRGMQLLKVGGRMVYSTCSLNPIEDEAVVSSLINWGKGSIRIVDTKAEGTDPLPSLKPAPGLTTWKVVDPKTGAYYSTFDEVPQASRCTVTPSMFPSGVDTKACMRLYPWLYNSGGFFVTLLEKTGDVPDDAAKEETTESKKVRLPLGASAHPWKEQPLMPLKDDVIQSICKQFGMDQEVFPKELFMSRSLSTVWKTTLLTPESVSFISGASIEAIRKGEITNSAIVAEHSRLRVVNAGLFVLECKQGGLESLHNKGEKLTMYWRVPQNAGPFVVPMCAARYIGKLPYPVAIKCLKAGVEDSTNPLEQMIRFDDPIWATNAATASTLKRLQDIAEKEFRGVGCISLSPPEEEAPWSKLIRNGLLLSCWVGGNSFGFHITKRMKSTLLQLIAAADEAIDIQRKKKAE